MEYKNIVRIAAEIGLLLVLGQFAGAVPIVISGPTANLASGSFTVGGSTFVVSGGAVGIDTSTFITGNIFQAGSTAYKVAITSSAHIEFGGPALQLQNCGAGGSVAALGADSAALVTSGSGTTGCTVLFSNGYFSANPICIAVDNTRAAALQVKTSKSSMTVEGLTASDLFMYQCVGNQ